MKGVIVYDSKYGNTKIIAEELREGLSGSGHEVDLVQAKKSFKLGAGDYEFIVLGAPTHIGRTSRNSRNFLKKLPEDEWSGKRFAVFDTFLKSFSDKSPIETNAAEQIDAAFNYLGLVRLVKPSEFEVLGTRGPLAEGELDKAKIFASSINIALKK